MTRRTLGRNAVMVVRWWFGLGWTLGGIGGVIAALYQLADGRGLDPYLLLGGILIATFGWLVHPWGLTRHLRPLSEPLGDLFATDAATSLYEQRLQELADDADRRTDQDRSYGGW